MVKNTSRRTFQKLPHQTFLGLFLYFSSNWPIVGTCFRSLFYILHQVQLISFVTTITIQLSSSNGEYSGIDKVGLILLFLTLQDEKKSIIQSNRNQWVINLFSFIVFFYNFAIWFVANFLTSLILSWGF